MRTLCFLGGGAGLYLFTEAFDEKKQIGRIAVSRFLNGEFEIPKVIIKKPYHMSYPCVFTYKNDIYMLPETSQNATLELYRCKDGDITNFEKIGNLLKGVHLADSTVINENGSLYIYTYAEKPYISYLFSLNIESLKVSLIKKVARTSNCFRAAGNCFTGLDKRYSYMPLQESVSCYGESIRICLMETRHDLLCEIEPYMTITAESLRKLPGMESDIKRTHTIALDEEVMAVDVLRNFPAVKPDVKIFGQQITRRKLRNLKYKLIKRKKLQL